MNSVRFNPLRVWNLTEACCRGREDDGGWDNLIYRDGVWPWPKAATLTADMFSKFHFDYISSVQVATTAIFITITGYSSSQIRSKLANQALQREGKMKSVYAKGLSLFDSSAVNFTYRALLISFAGFTVR